MTEKEAFSQGGKKNPKPSKELRTIRIRPRTVFAIALVFAILISALSYFKDDGFKSIMAIDESIEAERESIKAIKAENESLKKKIKTVHNDDYQVEKFAREKLNLVKENELVFHFHEENREGF